MRSSLFVVTIGFTSAFIQPNHLVQQKLKASSTQVRMIESSSLVESATNVAQHLLPMTEDAIQPYVTQMMNDIECGPSVTGIAHFCDNTMSSYTDMLRNHPLPTKAATAGIIAGFGDAIAQRRSASSLGLDSQQQYDIMKGAAMIIFSVLYAGVFQHFWFDWLNNNLAETAVAVHPSVAMLLAQSYGPSLLAAAKLFINQALVVPAVYMPLFFAVTGALAGLTLDDTVTRARTQFGPLLKQKYAFWLPAQFVQFAFVAPEWQITYLCTAGLAWTVILSSFGASSVSSDNEVRRSSQVGS